MHSPEGQSEAPSAEHCPAQLAPWPQVATSKVLFGWQQVTLLVWLENVKAMSKKSTEVAVFPGNQCLIQDVFTLGLPLKVQSTKKLI